MLDHREPIIDRSAQLVLRTTETSPFGRKVRIAARVLNLGLHLDIRPADTRDPTDDLRSQNPLGKMPCLLIDSEAFYDSGVILEMLDALAGGGRLLPPQSQGLDRYRALTRARLADGITEAALLMVYERRFRTSEQVSAQWLDHQRGKVLRALSAFQDAPPSTDRAEIVSIGLACALGYLNWRTPVAWRDSHSGLSDWLDAFAASVPAFTSTERSPV